MSQDYVKKKVEIYRYIKIGYGTVINIFRLLTKYIITLNQQFLAVPVSFVLVWYRTFRFTK